jgi:hypothetical protein
MLLHPRTTVAEENIGYRDWDIAVNVAAATGEENRDAFSEAQLWTAGVFVGRIIARDLGKAWWKGNLEYGFDVIPLFIGTGAQHVFGGGFHPIVLRWNSSRRIGGLQPYIELAGGAVATNTNLPQGDTSTFNFTARGGGGLQISTKHNQSLDIGLRWWHLSNANLGVRNPEFNGVQFSVGYHWFK